MKFLEQRAIENVALLAKATEDWVTEAFRSPDKRWEAPVFEAWWLKLVNSKGVWKQGLGFPNGPRVRYSHVEAAFRLWSGSFFSIYKQQTDSLDKLMILTTKVSNGNTLRGIGHELGEPSADAFDKVLIRESKNHRVKKSLIFEYLNLMRKPGFTNLSKQ